MQLKLLYCTLKYNASFKIIVAPLTLNIFILSKLKLYLFYNFIIRF